MTANWWLSLRKMKNEKILCYGAILNSLQDLTSLQGRINKLFSCEKISLSN